MSRLAWIGWGAAFLIALGWHIAAAAPPDPWLLDCAGDALGLPFPATPQNMVQHFGANNYIARDLDEGEGILTPGAIIFSNVPRQSLAVLWTDRSRSNVLAIYPWQDHYDPALSARSLWHTRQGIRVGTPLRDLERLNGRPFILLGFGWDYSGTVVDWRGGKLQSLLIGSQCRVLVRLSNPASYQPQLWGDRPLCSNRPDLRSPGSVLYAWEVAFGRDPSPHDPPPACPAK